MKEVIIKYKDSRFLELLKGLAAYFDFSVSEKKEADHGKKNVSFNAVKLNTRGFTFDRNQANER